MIESLADLFLAHGQPKYLRSDNGPEFTSALVRKWLLGLDVRTLYIEPGSPWENGYIESHFSILEKEFPSGSVIEVVPQGGGIANPLAVATGKVDVALANVATSKWAYDGIQMYEGKSAKNIPSSLAALNSTGARCSRKRIDFWSPAAECWWRCTWRHVTPSCRAMRPPPVRSSSNGDGPADK